jgi:hypothetical protein
MSSTSTRWAERAGLRERLIVAWRHYGEITCAACGTTLDLEAADDEKDVAQLWNDHVDDAGGTRYV